MPFVTTTPLNQPFGSAGNIGAASGSYFQLANPGYSTLGFNANPDGNGIIQFKGSFDGVNYDDITLRQLGNDGYSYECSGSSPADYIGSIAALRAIRFVNKTGSASPCSVVGTMSAAVSTLEGIENGPAPHRFGNQLVNIGFDVSAATVTNSGLFTPALRHKFVVTDISFGIASATPYPSLSTRVRAMWGSQTNGRSPLTRISEALKLLRSARDSTCHTSRRSQRWVSS